MRRAIAMTLYTLVMAVALIIVLVYFGQRSMMYFPDGESPLLRDWDLAGAENVMLQTEDGLELGAWFVKPREPASGYTVIVFNGNAGHRGYRAGLARGFSRRGVAVLLFDYRGYGGNPGLPHERGIGRDARAALAYVQGRADVDRQRIVYFGESLGTAVAVALAREHAPAALILRSPFTSFAAVARYHYPGVPAEWLLRDRYDSMAVIDQIRSPVLVIAGDNDQIVPFEESQELFERARDPKRLVTVPGADHNDEALTDGAPVIDAVAEWLQLPQ